MKIFNLDKIVSVDVNDLYRFIPTKFTDTEIYFSIDGYTCYKPKVTIIFTNDKLEKYFDTYGEALIWSREYSDSIQNKLIIE